MRHRQDAAAAPRRERSNGNRNRSPRGTAPLLLLLLTLTLTMAATMGATMAPARRTAAPPAPAPRLSAVYREAAEHCGARLALVEHAAVDVRIEEALLALALHCSGGEPAVVGGDAQRLAWLAEDLIDGKRRRNAGVTRFELADGRLLWLCPDLSLVPSRVEDVFLANAHALARPPSPLPLRGVLAGWLAPREHWFYDLVRSRAHPTTRIDLGRATGIWPELADQADPRSGSHRRSMLLIDEPPRQTPVSAFARRRLKVQTIKGPEFLTPLQREEARAQLGEGWATGRAGTPIVTFDVSRLQRRYMAAKRRGRMLGFRKFLLLKYRRGGFTTLEQADSYRMCDEQPHSHVATLADSLDKTRRIARMVGRFHELDPSPQARTNDSSTELELANGSYYFIGTAGGKNAFRGDSMRRVHGSEVAFWCDSQVHRVEALVAGITGACDKGEIVFETTANGIEWFCHTWREAKRGQNDWFPIFVRWFDDPTNVAPEGTYDEAEILETLTKEERDLVAAHGLSTAQIAFRRAKKKEYKSLFPQEMPEDDEACFLTSGIRFFDVEAVTAMLKREEAGERKTLPGGYEVRWEEPQRGVRYCAGTDTSEGLPGGDLNGTGILRKDTGAQVAAIHGRFDTTALATQTVRLCREYNDALLGVERENHGHAVLRKVIELGYGRPHFQGGSLFHFAGNRSNRKTWRAGWSTNATTRPQILDGLADVIEEMDEGIRDRDLLSECLSFAKQSNGRFEADSGCNDDAVMKWAIAYEMRRQRVPRPQIGSMKLG